MLRFRLAVASSVVAAGFIACVGDDPTATTTPSNDAGGTTDTGSPPNDATAPGDDAGDAAQPRCRTEDPFAAPVELANVNDLSPTHPRLTADELEMFFQSRKDKRIYVARRGTTTVAFDPPQLLATAVADAADTAQDPSISGDGKTLFFSLGSKLAKMDRTDRVSPFGTPQLIGLDDPDALEQDPHVLPDKSALYFGREAADGGTSMFRAASGTTGFAAPTAIVVPGQPVHPSASEDELTLYYADTTDGRIHRVTRGSTAEIFGNATVVAELSVSADAGGTDRPGWLSPDGCRMYLAAGGLQTSKLYLATKKPR